MSELNQATGCSFGFQFNGNTSRMSTGGDVAFDTERKLWRATIIAQTNPEVRFDAWDEDPAVAALIACGKWMGRDLASERANQCARLLSAAQVLREYLESPACLVCGFDVPDEIWRPFTDAIDNPNLSPAAPDAK